MSNVLPIIEMPVSEPEPPPPPILENPDGDQDIIKKIEESIECKSDDEEDIINIEPRDIPNEEDVFTNPPTIKPIQGVPSAVNDEPPSEFEPAKKGKRKYVRKAPMSLKQKEHLERIRKIAAEKKAIKKKEKEEQKAQDKLLLEQKKQEEQEKKEEEKRIKEEKKIQDAVNKRLEKQNKPESEQRGTPQNYFTKEDIENAMLSAITTYDTIRKKQKQEKKVRIEKEARESQMRRTLENAIRPPQVQNDPWRNLFT